MWVWVQFVISILIAAGFVAYVFILLRRYYLQYEYIFFTQYAIRYALLKTLVMVLFLGLVVAIPYGFFSLFNLPAYCFNGLVYLCIMFVWETFSELLETVFDKFIGL